MKKMFLAIGLLSAAFTASVALADDASTSAPASTMSGQQAPAADSNGSVSSSSVSGTGQATQ